MMQSLCRGSILIRRRDRIVRHELVKELLEPAIVDRLYKLAESAPELVDVLWGLGEIVGVIDLPVGQLADLVDGELPAAIVLLDQAFNFDEVILIEGIEGVRNVVPHVRLEVSAAICQGDREIGIAALLVLD